MADLFNIGLSGLKSSQTNLSITGQNISNINTPGYTRQTALQAARDPSFTGAGYIGNGTNIVDVQRIHNQFLTNQVRTSTSMNAEITAFQTQIEELNGLLAGSATGINPAMQSFFDALQTAIEDPRSLPARQLFLTEAGGMASKFNAVEERLTVQNEFIGQQMGTVTEQVNRLASNIASYNNSIATASSQGAQPNDLLDARDEAIRQLSEYVGVTVVAQDNNTVNLFVGTGQPLVVGNDASSLIVKPGSSDPNRVEIRLKSGNSEQDITGLVSGGELGGLLRYRGELDNALNSVGRLALSMASEFNQQLAQGLDLNGNLGGELFTDINSDQLIKGRSVPIGDNVTGSLAITIEDTSKLTTSDYEATSDGEGNFSLRRLSDGKIVDAVAEGFSINLEGGETPANGDRFLIMPTRTGAGAIGVQMKNPQELAFAAPVSGETSPGNRGTAAITQPVITAPQPLSLDVLKDLDAKILFDGDKFTLDGDVVTTVPEDYKPGSIATLNFTVDGHSFEIEMTGTPLNGDSFELAFNSGTSDNRNALELSKLQSDRVMGQTGENKKGASFADAYGTLIQHVGTQTAQARAESEASGAVLKQATNNRDSVSAVNLDEEAANLMKFEQYYNASAQVIQIARSIFDTLISSIR
ncbi:flagellar hook-associated protein FlgK [Pseudomonas profundi]|uniref:flagellar hook-associated protein FlgK n=1 Tax=Pseudomonas profundi TaxID=1981513 RepID=UPI00123C5FE8|nr:flagellar hook-associated protein FlgK [Pseudomonas profundi]